MAVCISLVIGATDCQAHASTLFLEALTTTAQCGQVCITAPQSYCLFITVDAPGYEELSISPGYCAVTVI